MIQSATDRCAALVPPSLSAYLGMLARPKKKRRKNLRTYGVNFGGLGRNRTIDTRIFNAKLQTKERIFSKSSTVQAKVVCVFCANKPTLQTK
jgi:hypothetical protein